jgi:hypothetical protein
MCIRLSCHRRAFFSRFTPSCGSTNSATRKSVDEGRTARRANAEQSQELFDVCVAWRRFNNPLSTFDHGAPPVFEKITLATTKGITVEDEDIAIA